jgi:syntaxin 17
MKFFQDVNEITNTSEENVGDIRHDKRDVFSTSKAYPMAGAVLGTCLGGPVGFLAGVKIGGLAAVGGSLFGEIGFSLGKHCYRLFWFQDTPLDL